MSVDNHFNTIYEKLQQLLKVHARCRKEMDKLRTELDQQKRAYDAARAEVQALEQQISILKMGAGEMSEKDKKTFERKIDQYVREIDKCISFLGR